MAKQRVTIVEMGLRDGLQNETVTLTPSVRLELIQKLVNSGIRRIEIGAFVSPKWVPQMAGSGELVRSALRLQKEKRISRNIEFSALVPNEKGMIMAMETGIREIAVFASASESFSKKNINCNIDESFARFEPVIALAIKNKIKIRGYLSACFGCPFEGKVNAKQALKVIERLADLGVEQVSIGDTIGVGTPNQVDAIVRPALRSLGAKKVAVHFHDTRGTALANTLRALELGVKSFDSSAGGLGGCPFAPGASGNLATEDLLYMLHGMGVKTGIDLEALCRVSLDLARLMSRPLSSRYLQTYSHS
jgi:hydroxymethylglutaryl-CoA lyase